MDGDTTAQRAMVSGQEASEFELLFFEHYAPVLRLLTRLTGNRAYAEELANEVFWRLSRRPNSWLAQQNVAPWLYRTTINVGIDSLRALNKRERYERDGGRGCHADSQSGPLDDLMRREEQKRVQTVLAKMKPVRAQLLLMRSCDWAYREIADALGLAPGSVGTLLSRAEEEFRNVYLSVTAKESKK